MNRIQKGRRAEDLCKKILREQGYLIEYKPRLDIRRAAKYSPDLYELFDLIAISTVKHIPLGIYMPRLIQVKTNISHCSGAKKSIAKWVDENKPAISAEVWLYRGKSLWTVYLYDGKEWSQNDIKF